MAAAPKEPSSRIDDLVARRDRLRQRRQALRVARDAEDAEAAAFAVVMQAVVQARRDRDAATSTRMQRHRVAFEQVMSDVEEAALMVARVGHRIMRLELPQNDPVRQRAERAARRGLQALQRLSDDLRVAVHVEEITAGAERAETRSVGGC